MPEKYVSVDGIATHVVHAGSTTLPDRAPDTSRGRALLGLHGSGNNACTFGPLFGHLEAEHSPLAFDQPGHARSGGLDSLGSVDRMAAFTVGVIGALELERPVLVGHSLGGAVALQAALLAGESIAGLVILGSAARFPTLPDAALDELRQVTQGRRRRRFTRDAFSPSTPDEVVHRNWMEDAKTDPRVMLGDMLAVRAHDVEARLSEIRMPCLVVWGSDEFAPLREAGGSLAESLPQARGVEIAEAGHMVHFEQPEAVAGEVRRFLGELSA